MPAAARSTPLNVMVRRYHVEALDRIAAITPGVETRSAVIRMLIEQADPAQPQSKAIAAQA